MDRLPPEVAEKVMKMSPEERRAWFQQRRAERAQQNAAP
jgi:multidrug efflux system membrane fusion protein